MNKFNTLAALVAIATLVGCATQGTSAPVAASATRTIDNWRSTDGIVWKNGTNEYCWRNNFWTPATAVAECDGALKPPPAPAAVPAAPAVAPAAPAPAMAPTPVPVSEKITFAADAFFDFDKSVLKSEGQAKIDDVVSKLGSINLEVIIAVGHTDSIGTDAYNQALSLRRSEAVKAYFLSKGVDKNRVYTEGKGEKQPVADNKTGDGRAKNRRVEIEVVGTKAVKK